MFLATIGYKSQQDDNYFFNFCKNISITEKKREMHASFHNNMTQEKKENNSFTN